MIPDAVYVQKAVEGDDTAFDVLVKRHRPKIYEVAHRMLGNQRDAERITHASFLAARKHIRAFQGRTAFGTWAYRIAVNLCLGYDRSSNRLAGEVSEW